MNQIVDLSSDQSVSTLTETLSQANNDVATQGVTLSAVDRKHLLKMRNGAQQAVPEIFDLAERYGIKLPSYSLDQGRTDLQTVVRIGGLAKVVATLDRAVRDDLLSKQSSVWQAATSLYSALQSLAAHEPKLADELILLRNYFQRKVLTQASKQPAKPVAKGKGQSATPTPAEPVVPATVSATSHGNHKIAD